MSLGNDKRQTTNDKRQTDSYRLVAISPIRLMSFVDIHRTALQAWQPIERLYDHA
ncbi:hypothetical protein KA093_00055 [Candidatus Saccharibacteria bacterium]|nr:hypothetical protein [Candidatus Saccharibacteria bacterium]